MTKTILDRGRLLKLATVLFVSGLLSLGAIKAYSNRMSPSQKDLRAQQKDDKDDDEREENTEKYLFVWSGDQPRTNPDFLAVINFDERSNNWSFRTIS